MNSYGIIRNAIENEIAIDEYLIEKFSLEKKRSAVFKVARFKNRIPLIFNFFALPLLPFYFLIIIYKSLRISKGTSLKIVNSRIFFSFTTSPKIFALYNGYSNCTSLVNCVEGRNLNFIHHLSYFDLFKGFLNSLFYSLRLMLEIKKKYYLQLTSVFEITVFLVFLKKVHKSGIDNIVLTNHYDRWITAIAFTDLFKIKIIQHGILDKKFTVPHMLPNITEITCFSKYQYNIFNENICLNPIKSCDFLRSDLEVVKDDKCKVFIISNPFYLAQEVKFYHALTKAGFKTLFRPHPLYLGDEMILQIASEDICIGKRYPAADISLCRESTLGVEYENAGYQVYWWDDNSSLEEIIKMAEG